MQLTTTISFLLGSAVLAIAIPTAQVDARKEPTPIGILGTVVEYGHDVCSIASQNTRLLRRPRMRNVSRSSREVRSVDFNFEAKDCYCRLSTKFGLLELQLINFNLVELFYDKACRQRFIQLDR